MKITTTINEKEYTVDVDGEMPLLWVLRDEIGLTGTKYGCGKGLCGSCTVHLDGKAVRSCVLPIKTVGESKVTTIEGLSENGDHPLQKTWLEHAVPQCGFCQPGQIMSALAFLKENSSPSDDDIDSAMSGNICRCGTYTRIKDAIKDAAGKV